jgi:hypothetical protein
MTSWQRKSVFEILPWAALGATILGILISMKFMKIYYFGMLCEEIAFLTWITSSFTAGLVGLNLYGLDQRTQARDFLIHRAVEPRLLILRRMRIHACVLLSLSPMFMPVTPSLVIPSLVAIPFSFAFYLGAIIVVCRRGAPYQLHPKGIAINRVLPVAAAFVVSLSWLPLVMMPWLLGSLAVIGFGIAGWLCICQAAIDSFTQSHLFDAPIARRPRSVALILVLLGSSVVMTLLLAEISRRATTWTSSRQRVSDTLTIVVANDGELWTAKERPREPDFATRMVLQKRLRDGAIFSKELEGSVWATELLQYPNYIPSASTWPNHSFQWSFADVGTISFEFRAYYFDGYIYLYRTPESSGHQLQMIVGSERVSLPGEERGKPFRNTPRNISTGFTLSLKEPRGPSVFETSNSDKSIVWSDQNSLMCIANDGLYVVDLQKRTVTHQIQEEVIRWQHFLRMKNSTEGTKIFSFANDKSIQFWEGKLDTSNDSTNYNKIDERSLSFNERFFRGSMQDPDNWVSLAEHVLDNGLIQFNVTHCREGKVDHYENKVYFKNLKLAQNEGEFITQLFGAIHPPVYGSFETWVSQKIYQRRVPLATWCVIGLHSVFATICCWMIMRYRDVAGSNPWIWLLLAVFLGWATTITMLAWFPRRTRVPRSVRVSPVAYASRV